MYIDGYAVLLDAICRRLIKQGVRGGRRFSLGRAAVEAEMGEKLGQQIGLFSRPRSWTWIW